MRNWKWRLFIVLTFAFMSAYPIYTNYYRGKAVLQLSRHQAFLNGSSIFFNPWQYRVLSPLLVEATFVVFDYTVFRVIDFSELSKVNLIQGPEDKVAAERDISRKANIIKHNIVFAFFRFVQNVIILYLSYLYFMLFVRNRLFGFFGVLFVSLIMGNAVVDSDLSFNVYMDIIFFLLAGIVIAKPCNDWWILPITVLGALNRETSALIPAMYFFSRGGWVHYPDVLRVLPGRRPFLITSLSAVCFVLIFVLIRLYYGYKSPEEWHIPTGWEMLKMNLFSNESIKSYMELFAVFAVMPILCLLIFKRMNLILRIFFLTIVPVWFAINFWHGIVSESRIFLVPTLLVFLPATLELIDRGWEDDSVKSGQVAD